MIAGTVTTPAMVEVIETARGQHQLIEVGRYARCACGVEFQWGADLYRRQYQEHWEERIANAAVAAALAAAEQRADTLAAANAEALRLLDESEHACSPQSRYEPLIAWTMLKDVRAALSSRPVQPEGKQR